MINLTSKNALLYAALLALTACGSEGVVTSPTEDPGSNDTPTGTPTGPTVDPTALLIGKSHYEDNCSTCHGVSGENSLNPINTDACLVADCSSIDSLASYINTFMPPTNTLACSLDGENSCAQTTATYIVNGFSTEIETPDPDAPPEETEEGVDAIPVDPVPTPLARLTNDEFTNSVRTVLNLPDNSPLVNVAKSALASESIIKGLTSDSASQTITQLTVSGYSTMAAAASEDLLGNISTKNALEALLDCPALLENVETTAPTRTCVEEFSKNLITKAYRRPATEDDAENISAVYDNIIGLNQDANNALYDVNAHTTTLQSIIQFILMSPEFVLVAEKGKAGNATAISKELTDQEIATRLALFLGGTLPDDALLADADAGLMRDHQIRLQHANRLMNSAVGTTQFTSLVSNWLDIDTLSSDTADVNSANAFITSWFVNEAPFSDLYQAPVTVKHIDGTASTEPLGVLGLRAFVASHTSFPTPSFITRGAFFVERLLCEKLPEDLPDGALDAGILTPVEVFEVHDQQACATCHKVFDNYGAAFQQFDAETALFNPAFQDFGSSFDLYQIGDVGSTVSGLGDLSHTMASSAQASSCMAELWYRHSMRRNVDDDGKDAVVLQALVSKWTESGDQSMKALLRTIVTSESFIRLFL